MKSIVRILSLILAISCLICLFVSCNNKDENQDENPTPEVEYVDYTVCVVDDYGNPMTDVMVRFVNEDGEIKSRLTFEDGIATYKNAVAGKYIVLLEKGNSNAIFTQTEYQLTKANNTLTVVVRNEKKTTDIYGDAVDEDDYAHNIAEGEHKINGKAGETSYFLLKVFLSGKYKSSPCRVGSRARVMSAFLWSVTMGAATPVRCSMMQARDSATNCCSSLAKAMVVRPSAMR